MKHMIPSDNTERVKWAGDLARTIHLPQDLKTHAAHLAPADRIPYLYPKGIIRGALLGLQEMAIAGMSIPPGITAKRQDPASLAWATALATGVTLPPKAAFTSSKVGEKLSRIYHAGITRGLLLCLDSCPKKAKPR